jgi:hypothetical protein
MTLPPFICIRKMDIDIDFALATNAGKDALRQRPPVPRRGLSGWIERCSTNGVSGPLTSADDVVAGAFDR